MYTGSACKLSFNLLYSSLSIFCTGCACQLLLKTMMMMMTKNKGNENSTRFDTHDNHPAWTSSNVEQSCRRHALSISDASTAVESHCGPLPTPANLRSDTIPCILTHCNYSQHASIKLDNENIGGHLTLLHICPTYKTFIT